MIEALHRNGFGEDDVIQRLRILTQRQQFTLMQQEVLRAAKAIAHRKPVLFLSYDDTPAGDVHCVSGIYEPETNSFGIEIPNEPSDIDDGSGKTYTKRGGRFPTVLHTIEMLVASCKLVEKIGEPLENEKPVFPELEFLNTEIFDDRLNARGHLPVTSRIPLIYQPLTSNVLFFNKNARGRDMSAGAIAQAHYDAMRADANIPEVLLRHTMLLEGMVIGGNKVIGITVMQGWETRQYKLFRTARINQSWDQPIQVPEFLGITLDLHGRPIRRYSLESK